MLKSYGSLSNRGRLGSGLTHMQLSFSTADLEDFVFYGQAKELPTGQQARGIPHAEEPQLPVYKALVVNGEVYYLNEDGVPPGVQIPAEDEGGLLALIDIEGQAKPHR